MKKNKTNNLSKELNDLIEQHKTGKRKKQISSKGMKKTFKLLRAQLAKQPRNYDDFKKGP